MLNEHTNEDVFVVLQIRNFKKLFDKAGKARVKEMKVAKTELQKHLEPVKKAIGQLPEILQVCDLAIFVIKPS